MAPLEIGEHSCRSRIIRSALLHRIRWEQQYAIMSEPAVLTAVGTAVPESADCVKASPWTRPASFPFISEAHYAEADTVVNSDTVDGGVTSISNSDSNGNINENSGSGSPPTSHVYVLLVTTAINAGYAALVVLQGKLRDRLEVSSDPSSRSAHLFAAATSCQFIGNLIFHIGHNIIFCWLTPRNRVYLSLIIMVITMGILLGMFWLTAAVDPADSSISFFLLILLVMVYSLGGMSTGIFDANFISTITPLGERTKGWALLGQPIGFKIISILGFALMGFVDLPVVYLYGFVFLINIAAAFIFWKCVRVGVGESSGEEQKGEEELPEVMETECGSHDNVVGDANGGVNGSPSSSSVTVDSDSGGVGISKAAGIQVFDDAAESETSLGSRVGPSASTSVGSESNNSSIVSSIASSSDPSGSESGSSSKNYANETSVRRKSVTNSEVETSAAASDASRTNANSTTSSRTIVSKVDESPKNLKVRKSKPLPFLTSLKRYREWLHPEFWAYLLFWCIHCCCLIMVPLLTLSLFPNKYVPLFVDAPRGSDGTNVFLPHDIYFLILHILVFISDLLARKIIYHLDFNKYLGASRKHQLLSLTLFVSFSVCGIILTLLKYGISVLIGGFLVFLGNGSFYAATTRFIDNKLPAIHNLAALSVWLFAGDLGLVVGSNCWIFLDEWICPSGGDYYFTCVKKSPGQMAPSRILPGKSKAAASPVVPSPASTVRTMTPNNENEANGDPARTDPSSGRTQSVSGPVSLREKVGLGGSSLEARLSSARWKYARSRRSHEFHDFHYHDPTSALSNLIFKISETIQDGTTKKPATASTAQTKSPESDTVTSPRSRGTSPRSQRSDTTSPVSSVEQRKFYHSGDIYDEQSRLTSESEISSLNSDSDVATNNSSKRKKNRSSRSGGKMSANEITTGGSSGARIRSRKRRERKKKSEKLAKRISQKMNAQARNSTKESADSITPHNNVNAVTPHDGSSVTAGTVIRGTTAGGTTTKSNPVVPALSIPESPIFTPITTPTPKGERNRGETKKKKTEPEDPPSQPSLREEVGLGRSSLEARLTTARWNYASSRESHEYHDNHYHDTANFSPPRRVSSAQADQSKCSHQLRDGDQGRAVDHENDVDSEDTRIYKDEEVLSETPQKSKSIGRVETSSLGSKSPLNGLPSNPVALAAETSLALASLYRSASSSARKAERREESRRRKKERSAERNHLERDHSNNCRANICRFGNASNRNAANKNANNFNNSGNNSNKNLLSIEAAWNGGLPRVSSKPRLSLMERQRELIERQKSQQREESERREESVRREKEKAAYQKKKLREERIARMNYGSRKSSVARKSSMPRKSSVSRELIIAVESESLQSTPREDGQLDRSANDGFHCAPNTTTQDTVATRVIKPIPITKQSMRTANEPVIVPPVVVQQAQQVSSVERILEYYIPPENILDASIGSLGVPASGKQFQNEEEQARSPRWNWRNKTWRNKPGREIAVEKLNQKEQKKNNATDHFYYTTDAVTGKRVKKHVLLKNVYDPWKSESRMRSLPVVTRTTKEYLAGASGGEKIGEIGRSRSEAKVEKKGGKGNNGRRGDGGDQNVNGRMSTNDGSENDDDGDDDSTATEKDDHTRSVDVSLLLDIGINTERNISQKSAVWNENPRESRANSRISRKAHPEPVADPLSTVSSFKELYFKTNSGTGGGNAVSPAGSAQSSREKSSGRTEKERTRSRNPSRSRGRPPPTSEKKIQFGGKYLTVPAFRFDAENNKQTPENNTQTSRTGRSPTARKEKVQKVSWSPPPWSPGGRLPAYRPRSQEKSSARENTTAQATRSETQPVRSASANPERPVNTHATTHPSPPAVKVIKPSNSALNICCNAIANLKDENNLNRTLNSSINRTLNSSMNSSQRSASARPHTDVTRGTKTTAIRKEIACAARGKGAGGNFYSSANHSAQMRAASAHLNLHSLQNNSPHYDDSGSNPNLKLERQLIKKALALRKQREELERQLAATVGRATGEVQSVNNVNNVGSGACPVTMGSEIEQSLKFAECPTREGGTKERTTPGNAPVTTSTVKPEWNSDTNLGTDSDKSKKNTFKNSSTRLKPAPVISEELSREKLIETAKLSLERKQIEEERQKFEEFDSSVLKPSRMKELKERRAKLAERRAAVEKRQREWEEKHMKRNNMKRNLMKGDAVRSVSATRDVRAASVRGGDSAETANLEKARAQSERRLVRDLEREQQTTEDEAANVSASKSNGVVASDTEVNTNFKSSVVTESNLRPSALRPPSIRRNTDLTTSKQSTEFATVANNRASSAITNNGDVALNIISPDDIEVSIAAMYRKYGVQRLAENQEVSTEKNESQEVSGRGSADINLPNSDASNFPGSEGARENVEESLREYLPRVTCEDRVGNQVQLCRDRSEDFPRRRATNNTSINRKRNNSAVKHTGPRPFKPIKKMITPIRGRGGRGKKRESPKTRNKRKSCAENPSDSGTKSGAKNSGTKSTEERRSSRGGQDVVSSEIADVDDVIDPNEVYENLDSNLDVVDLSDSDDDLRNGADDRVGRVQGEDGRECQEMESTRKSTQLGGARESELTRRRSSDKTTSKRTSAARVSASRVTSRASNHSARKTSSKSASIVCRKSAAKKSVTHEATATVKGSSATANNSSHITHRNTTHCERSGSYKQTEENSHSSQSSSRKTVNIISNQQSVSAHQTIEQEQMHSKRTSSHRNKRQAIDSARTREEKMEEDELDGYLPPASARQSAAARGSIGATGALSVEQREFSDQQIITRKSQMQQSQTAHQRKSHAHRKSDFKVADCYSKSELSKSESKSERNQQKKPESYRIFSGKSSGKSSVRTSSHKASSGKASSLQSPREPEFYNIYSCPSDNLPSETVDVPPSNIVEFSTSESPNNNPTTDNALAGECGALTPISSLNSPPLSRKFLGHQGVENFHDDDDDFKYLDDELMTNLENLNFDNVNFDNLDSNSVNFSPFEDPRSPLEDCGPCPFEEFLGRPVFDDNGEAIWLTPRDANRNQNTNQTTTNQTSQTPFVTPHTGSTNPAHLAIAEAPRISSPRPSSPRGTILDVGNSDQGETNSNSDSGSTTQTNGSNGSGGGGLRTAGSINSGTATSVPPPGTTTTAARVPPSVDTNNNGDRTNGDCKSNGGNTINNVPDDEVPLVKWLRPKQEMHKLRNGNDSKGNGGNASELRTTSTKYGGRATTTVGSTTSSLSGRYSNKRSYQSMQGFIGVGGG